MELLYAGPISDWNWRQTARKLVLAWLCIQEHFTEVGAHPAANKDPIAICTATVPVRGNTMTRFQVTPALLRKVRGNGPLLQFFALISRGPCTTALTDFYGNDPKKSSQLRSPLSHILPSPRRHSIFTLLRGWLPIVLGTVLLCKWLVCRR